MKNNRVCSQCNSPKYYCKGLCKSCYDKNLVPARWSRNSDFCINCKSSDRPHKGKDLCEKCYNTQKTDVLCACGCGLTVPKAGNKIKKFRKGHWMRGNAEFMKAHIQAMTGSNNPQYGKFGENHPAFGHFTTDKTREERRQRRLKALSSKSNKRTSIEIILSNILDELRVRHCSQYTMYGKFTVDEFLPEYNVIIEAFGGYWHGDTRKFPVLTERQEKTQKVDATRIKYLNTCGNPVLVLWEKELNENPKWCKEQIISFIS